MAGKWRDTRSPPTTTAWPLAPLREQDWDPAVGPAAALGHSTQTPRAVRLGFLSSFFFSKMEEVKQTHCQPVARPRSDQTGSQSHILELCRHCSLPQPPGQSPRNRLCNQAMLHSLVQDKSFPPSPSTPGCPHTPGSSPDHPGCIL